MPAFTGVEAPNSLTPDLYSSSILILFSMHLFLSADKAVAIIEKELGQPIEKMFKAFDRRPIAAASLGQVWGKYVAGVGRCEADHA